jgi:hypothetical protein
MEVRMRGHKHKSKSDCSSKQIIDRGDYREEILEEHDYTETEAHERENFYIDNFECVNKNRAGIPGRTKKEWCEANKEKIKEKKKEYYKANKEVLLEKHKEYYKANKEVLLEKKKEKITCVCGSVFTKTHKVRHERSQKHQAFLNK